MSVKIRDIRVICTAPEGINPVSYTHLDVYKRQMYTCLSRRWLTAEQRPDSRARPLTRWLPRPFEEARRWSLRQENIRAN